MADSTTGKRDWYIAKLEEEPEEIETLASKKKPRSDDHVSSSCIDSVSGLVMPRPDCEVTCKVASSSSQSVTSVSILQHEASSSSLPSLGLKPEGCLATVTLHTEEVGKSESLQEAVCREGKEEGVVKLPCEDQTEDAGDRQDVSSERSQKTQVLVGLKETDVGIVEYMSDHEGVPGILKQRYRDFLVNEIDEQGQVIRLTDMKCPEKKSILPFDHNEVLSKEDQEKLSALNVDQDKKAEYAFQVTDDKEQRTKVHQAIRHLFPKLDSSTVEEGGKKMVKVVKGSGGKLFYHIQDFNTWLTFYQGIRHLFSKLDSIMVKVNGRKMVKVFQV
ncbi:pseudouridylate synthase 7 homolog [Lytechinus pictus]|uniref:pseudouridylate synthase 7 homolog n=1 Tax=Lytechinus pictus TaxID=7653 RepID=UPI0030BA0165